ncbi:endolytic transglycosylase MltG [Candidatus Falkowbacteria bacterium CG10_big_fil_rev_8_21_14_0_10_43_11]|uniref:Endolytic murein transglycosylase n=1 Tax=Candidatus Falkowbacteria bacterium CG10_big_fil_rev_8_21_14_0_10_43_11 TaxID=1974568 RepID=A0A2M6WM02_9BACT|nr:MAG: endolytic transglycosylase MltG [Candidatus Falkowbacteria bacterium CG10_big_fil_rev_8_21_14_0_10_43_11]
MLQKLTTYLGISLSLAVLIIATLYLTVWRGINEPMQMESAEVNFIIEQGQGVRQIGNQLAKEGLIRRPFYFYFYTAFKKTDKSLKAGEYLLNKNINLREIAKKLAGGDIAERERTIKILEGWNIKEIGEYLEKNNIARADDFIALTKPAPGACFSLESCQVSVLSEIPVGATLEGYLFPDTYRIFKNAAAEDIIAKMLKNFDAKLTPSLRADIKKQGKTLPEIITLASIIEKEVPRSEDMKKIAGIFYQRLKISMALQSDATVNFVTGKGATRPSAEDLQVASPYNTYKYRDLPPGPISNPGIEAIKAAIYPVKSDYFYFLTTPAGQVIYSRTYAEHLAEKYKYYK